MSLSFYNSIKWLFFSSTNFLEWRAQFCLCSQDDSEMAQTVTFLGGLKVKISNIVEVLSVLKNCPSVLRIKLICKSNVFFSRQIFFCWGKKSFSIKVDHVSTSTNASYVLRLHFFLQNTLFTILLNSYSAVLDVLLCFPFQRALEQSQDKLPFPLPGSSSCTCLMVAIGRWVEFNPCLFSNSCWEAIFVGHRKILFGLWVVDFLRK